MRVTKHHFTAVMGLMATLVFASSGSGALVSVLDGDGEAILSGKADYFFPSSPPFLYGIDAELEFAVYAPGTNWAASALGADPRTGASPANALVFAYRVLNTATSNNQGVTNVSVGFTDAVDFNNDAETLFEIGSIASTGDVSPTLLPGFEPKFEGNPISQARWQFNTGFGVGAGETSDILFYTALGSPEDDTAAMAIYNSGIGASAYVPTPGPELVPEPASLVLLAAGGLACLRRRR